MNELFNLTDKLYRFFMSSGLGIDTAVLLYNMSIFAILLLFWLITNIVTKKVIIAVVKKAIVNSRSEYDDILVNRNVFQPLSHMVPALIIYYIVPEISLSEKYIGFLQNLTYIYIIITILVVVMRLLSVSNEIYELIAHKKQLNTNIKGYIQGIKIVAVIFAIVLIISVLLNKEPGSILAGLGALTAVILLVFKDSLLGFVASIQLSSLNMLRVGDHITMPARQADGVVLDISLNTIKVQNFDNTISTIPTYAMVQESFTNHSNTILTGAKRIKRNITFDVNSFKPVNQSILQAVDFLQFNYNLYLENNPNASNIGLFITYVEHYISSRSIKYKKLVKQKFTINNVETEYYVIENIESFIEKFGSDVNEFVTFENGLWVLSDVDKFLLRFSDYFQLRSDILYFVHKTTHKKISKGVEYITEKYDRLIEQNGDFDTDLTMVIRIQEPTESGVPLQIYTFASTPEWVAFEKIQTNLFNHLLAVIPHFGLKVFQRPTVLYADV